MCPSSWPRTEKEEEDRQCRLDGGAVDAEDDGGGRSGDDVVGDRRDETEEEWSFVGPSVAFGIRHRKR